MHKKNIKTWQHHHFFNEEKKSSEKRTLIVVIITFVTMFVEIFYGWLYNSMALLADGCHMSTHALALSISLFAYILARKYSSDKKFTFGSWKIEILGAYTSAMFLIFIGIYVVYASIERYFRPLEIQYLKAVIVAVIGLVVNIVCALVLQHGHDHGHSHGYGHNHGNGHGHAHNHGDGHEHYKRSKKSSFKLISENNETDLNLKTAYVHVITDALTSLFAIIALIGAYYLKWVWLDPFMGIVGAILILRWAGLLVKDTSSILLDREMNFDIAEKVRNLIEQDNDSKISDLHLWRVAQNKYSCIISLVAKDPLSPKDYKNKLSKIEELAHMTIEVNSCE
mgnify:CR=1 FL=1